MPARPPGGAVDSKTVGFFFLKISKEIGKSCCKNRTREAREPHTPGGGVRREKKNMQNGQSVFSASLPRSRSLFSVVFQTFCLTTRAYLNTRKYGLFCSLEEQGLFYEGLNEVNR